MKEAEAQLRFALIAAQMGTFVWELATNRIRFACEALPDFSLSNFHGTLDEFLRYVHPEDRAPVQRELARCRETCSALIQEVRIVVAEREDWICLRGEFESEGENEVARMRGVITVVTARKRAELALRDKEHMLSESQRIAHIGSWHWDRAGRLTCSDEMYRIYAVAPDSVTWSVESFLKRLHPDDRPLLQRWLHACWSGKQPRELWFRALVPDGSPRWIRACGELKYDDAGRPSHLAGIMQDVTERKQAEAALRESEASLAAAQELARLGSWELSADARIARWSAQMFRFFERSPELGPPNSGEMLELIHPDDRAAFTSANKRLLRDGGSASIVIRSNPQRGLMKWFEGLIVARHDEPGQTRLLGTLQDVTERQQIQEAVRQKSAQLEYALNTAGMGVWSWDVQSDRAARLEGDGPITGLSTAELPQSSRAFFELVHPDDLAMVEEKVARALGGEDYDAEFRIVLPSGEVRWVAARGRCARDATGAPTVMTGLDRDITERKALEERLRHSQKMEAIGQLAGGIAHDFNNILAAIVGNAELARLDLPEQHPAATCIGEILRAGQRAKELTQRILTFSRPQAFRLRPIQLEPVLEEAERLLRATLPARVELSFHASRNVPAVRADATQIHQIVLNLVTNAWHAIESGPGRIEARLEAVRVDPQFCQIRPELQPGRYVRLTVRDTGIGMDAATLEHIFEPFFTTKALGHGAGLGLSVVHGIVRGHGGTIFAESQVGRGTTFHVYFPACAEGTRPAVQEAPAVRDIHGRGEHILYIDDEESLVYLAVRFLERGGYRVDGFTRGQEALTAFRAKPRSYDVVITDYNMPGMSGMELAQQLMRIRPDAPVALTSGYLRPSEIEAAHALGIREVIPKPYLVEELGPIVRRMLTAPAGS